MKLLFIILIISSGAHAENFKIFGDIKNFEHKEGLLINGCEKGCEALKVIKEHKKIDLKKARAGMRFSNSVGSDVCDHVYKADAFLGVASNKDRRAFCLFKDKSIVEINSLSEYLLKHKIVTE